VTLDFLTTLAFAPSADAGGPGVLMLFVQIGLFVAIFYFLLIRPQRQQQKRHEERLKQIKRGDEVATTGGIIGEVIHIKDDRITLKSGESRLVVQRARIAEILTAPSPAPQPQETGKS
jgi:preprotein translocase subunit YajC